MASRYEYILELTDKMSGIMSKIGASGTKVYDKLHREQEKTIHNNDRMHNSFRGVGSMIASLGVGFAAFSLGKSIFNAGAEMETTRVSFEVLLGSLEKGNKMVKEISQYAAWSPYESAGLRENAKMMLGFQIAGEKVIPTLKMLGDVAMGNQEKLNRMTLAYSQMFSKGKLQGQEALQMIEAGFNPAAEIQKITGWSSIQYAKNMEKGLVSLALVEKAFKNVTSKGGVFFNMAAKQSQTVSGRFSTLKDNFNMLLTNIGEKSNDVFLDIINKFIKLVDKIGANTERIASFFSSLIKTISKTFDVVEWLFGGFNKLKLVPTIITSIGIAIVSVTAATKIWGLTLAVVTALSNPIGLIVVGITAVAIAIGWVIYKIDNWNERWTEVLYRMKLGGWGLQLELSLAWAKIQQGFSNAISGLKYVWFEFISIFNKRAGLEGMKNVLAEISKSGEKVLEIESRIATLNKLKSNKHSYIFEDGRGKILQKIESKVFGWGVKYGTEPLTGKVDSNLVTPTGTTAATSPIESTSAAIATGGNRPTNITINLQNLVGSISLTAADLKDGVSDIEKQVREAMLRVLNSVNQIAYQ